MEKRTKTAKMERIQKTIKIKTKIKRRTYLTYRWSLSIHKPRNYYELYSVTEGRKGGEGGVSWWVGRLV